MSEWVTHLLYLDDMTLLEHTARVLSVESTEKGPVVILDRTAFYPQGGGQPADRGLIFNGRTRFRVSMVRKTGVMVAHAGTFEGPPFEPGENVTVRVDAERRHLHSRLHSAGHLLDVAMRLAGYSLEPGKGFHFPEGPYVEYRGEIPVEERETLKQRLETICRDLIRKGHPVEIETVDYEAVADRCGMVPDYLTPGPSVRIVYVFGRPGCPCGGTHVQDIQEIGSMRITKIRVKKGVTRVSYALD